MLPLRGIQERDYFSDYKMTLSPSAFETEVRESKKKQVSHNEKVIVIVQYTFTEYTVFIPVLMTPWCSIKQDRTE